MSDKTNANQNKIITENENSLVRKNNINDSSPIVNTKENGFSSVEKTKLIKTAYYL